MQLSAVQIIRNCDGGSEAWWIWLCPCGGISSSYSPHNVCIRRCSWSSDADSLRYPTALEAGEATSYPQTLGSASCYQTTWHRDARPSRGDCVCTRMCVSVRTCVYAYCRGFKGPLGDCFFFLAQDHAIWHPSPPAMSRLWRL